MNDLQEAIATTSMRAFNEGVSRERNSIIELLEKHKQETACSCAGCEEWLNAFDFLIAEIKQGS
jgi:hypothetical protein